MARNLIWSNPTQTTQTTIDEKNKVIYVGSEVWKYENCPDLESYYFKDGEGKLVKATVPDALLKKVKRDERGQALVYDENGNSVGFVEVSFLDNKPIALYWKNDMIALRRLT